MDFRSQLRGALIAHGYTLQSTAEILGISVQSMTKRLKNRSGWRQADISRLADLIGKEQTLAIFFD